MSDIALITYTHAVAGDKHTHIKGDIERRTDKAIHLDGRHGPVIVPARWVSHITDGSKPSTTKEKQS